jgi:hypothetical protein
MWAGIQPYLGLPESLLHLQDRKYPEDGSRRFFQNVAKHLPDYVMSQFRRPQPDITLSEEYKSLLFFSQHLFYCPNINTNTKFHHNP